MGAILVYGPSGSGKSRAIKNLIPQNTGIISSDMKALPFKGWKSNYVTVLNDSKKPDLLKSNYIETRKPASVLAVMKTWEKTQ
jgi:predicted kinase